MRKTTFLFGLIFSTLSVMSQNSEISSKEMHQEVAWGVIYNSVGTLRAEPRYGSELVTQGLLGMPVKILEKKGGWMSIQTPDRYVGWINGAVREMTKSELEEYLRKPKVIITAFSTQ